ncbi:MAG: transcriptional repressor [Clostridium lundense]|nr:transcriptional repressor [Clostridium lundense]
MIMEKILKEHKIKITQGRLILISILSNSENALSVDEINEQLKNRGESLDLSTIYRNLELFTNKGIINKFDLGDGRYNYVINHEEHKHVLECAVCHKEVEIDCPMQQVEQLIRNKTGFTLTEDTHLDLKFQGVCKDCNVKKHK